MRETSEPEERDWIKRAAAGFEGPRFNSDVMESAVESFFDAFPYRHTRLVRHDGTTEHQRTLTKVGHQLFVFQDKLRHQLNNNRSGPKPQQGLIQLSHTVEGIQKRLRNEGIFYPNTGHPMSQDETEQKATNLLASRIFQYQGVDFACTHNEGRLRNIRDIPSDMDDMVKALARHTGAEFYMMGTWSRKPGENFYYDTASPRSAGALQSDVMPIIRGWFTQYQVETNIWRFNARVQDASPAVYPAMDGSFRPMLPLFEGDIEQKRTLLTEYFGYSYQYLGNRLPIRFDVRPNPNSKDSVVEQNVHFTRLPDGFDGAYNPASMEDDEIETWFTKLYNDQRHVNPTANWFQFAYGHGDSKRFELQESFHEHSQLRYTAFSRLFTSRLLRNDPRDAIVRAEILHQVPLLNNNTTSYNPYPDVDQLRARVANESALMELLTYSQEFEAVGPIDAMRGHWVEYWKTSPWVGEEPISPEIGVNGFGGWGVPKGYDFDKQLDGGMSMEDFGQWVKSGILIHPYTQTIFGGAYGNRVAVYTLIRAWVSLPLVAESAQSRRSAKVVRAEAERERILDTAEWLRGQIERSSLWLLAARREEIQAQPVDLMSQEWIRARHHKQPMLDDDGHLINEADLSPPASESSSDDDQRGISKSKKGVSKSRRQAKELIVEIPVKSSHHSTAGPGMRPEVAPEPTSGNPSRAGGSKTRGPGASKSNNSPPKKKRRK
ncbi:unnamed protein product [Rhizoctonia solani]|uniref:Uncharacterized protein n=1 Tax=Rhizoctonia solani TaxID=456999 RepID=A0A8H2XP68_9AGAM|nr:unnamed protein product [Rhizoctonia solani]